MENGPFIVDLPIKNGEFPMALLNNQMVTGNMITHSIQFFHPKKH